MRTIALVCTLIVQFIVAVPLGHAGEHDWAIVIGNQAYRQGTPEVAFAKNDAKAFAKAAADIFKVPATNIIRADDASLGDFYRIFGAPTGGAGQLDALVKHPEAKLYIFYSGHGVPVMRKDRARPSLLPVDATPAAAASTAYGLDDLVAAVRRVMQEKAPRGRAIVILDACFSGTSDGGTLSPDTSAGSVPVEIAPISDIMVLSAATDREVAHWDRGRNHGLFTDALLSGLYGGADAASSGGNGDKAITLGELEAYVSRRMGGRLRELHPGRIIVQTPVLRGAATSVLVRFDGAVPDRDPVARTAEERECSYLAQFGKAADIDAFLGRCVTCACRPALEAKRAKLAAAPLDCEAETPMWKQIEAKGNMDEVRWMAANTRCDTIKSAAAAVIAKVAAREDAAKKKIDDERQRLAAQQKQQERDIERAKLDQERRALEEERRRIEEERVVAERARLRAEEERRAVEEQRRRAEADAARRLAEEAARRAAEEAARRRIADATPTPRPAPPSSGPACGWYAIMYCTKDQSQASSWVRNNGGGRVINTSHSATYPNFAAGWYCVVDGPYSDKSRAETLMERWRRSGSAPTAYIKNAC